MFTTRSIFHCLCLSLSFVLLVRRARIEKEKKLTYRIHWDNIFVCLDHIIVGCSSWIIYNQFWRRIHYCSDIVCQMRRKWSEYTCIAYTIRYGHIFRNFSPTIWLHIIWLQYFFVENKNGSNSKQWNKHNFIIFQLRFTYIFIYLWNQNRMIFISFHEIQFYYINYYFIW